MLGLLARVPGGAAWVQPAPIQAPQPCHPNAATFLLPAVDVRNSGYVASEYTVNVAECSAGVRPLQAGLGSLDGLPRAPSMSASFCTGSLPGPHLPPHAPATPAPIGCRPSAPPSPPSRCTASPLRLRWKLTKPPTAPARVGGLAAFLRCMLRGHICLRLSCWGSASVLYHVAPTHRRHLQSR